MNAESLARELARFDAAAPIESAWTPPASWYVAAEFLDLEQRSVFRDTWQPVGRVDQVASPGDFFCGVFLGQPYVVLRDSSGELRAFHNACSHHAAQVACGQGRATELVCPYHGWTYALDGRLRSAPRLGRAVNFDVAEFGLKPIATRTWGPLVWLYFGVSPRSLEDDLAPLHARLHAASFSELRFVARKEYTLHCNWKVYVDNYLDGGYHVAHLHHGLAGQLDLSGYHNEVHPRFTVQSCPGGDGRAVGVDFRERLGDEAIYAWVYPNFMINRYGPMMDTNWVVPLGPDRTLTVFDYYFDFRAGPPSEDFIRRSLAASHQVQVEDVGICESVQIGLGSPAYDRGRYAPSLEIGEYHFHQMLRKEMSDVFASDE